MLFLRNADLKEFHLKLASLKFGSAARASACPTRHWCVGAVRRSSVAGTADASDPIRQIDILEEALDELLRLTAPSDVVIRLMGIRRVSGRWLLDAVICWRGSAPEDTSSVSLEIGVGLRITSVGRP